MPILGALFITGAEVLASSINANKRIKQIQLGDHELVNRNCKFCWEHHHLFKRYCLPQVTLKSNDDAPSSNINFLKSQALEAGAYKNRIYQPGQTKRWKFPLKYLRLNLATLFSITPNGAK